VDLLNVHSEAASSIEPTWTLIAFEMLCFLMLHQDWFLVRVVPIIIAAALTFLILKLSLAVPTPRS
jgi:hypothetical protein